MYFKKSLNLLLILLGYHKYTPVRVVRTHLTSSLWTDVKKSQVRFFFRLCSPLQNIFARNSVKVAWTNEQTNLKSKSWRHVVLTKIFLSIWRNKKRPIIASDVALPLSKKIYTSIGSKTHFNDNIVKRQATEKILEAAKIALTGLGVPLTN